MKDPVDIINSSTEKLFYAVYLASAKESSPVVIDIKLTLASGLGFYHPLDDMLKLITQDKILRVIGLSEIVTPDEFSLFLLMQTETFLLYFRQNPPERNG